MDTVFSVFSIIFIRDIAQFPPVLDKPLYCPISRDPMAMMGFFALRKVNHVVKLEQNLITSKLDQQEFRELLLLRLRNGEPTIADWNLLNICSLGYFSLKQISNFKTRLAQTNEAVCAYNFNMLLKNGTTIITLIKNFVSYCRFFYFLGENV